MSEQGNITISNDAFNSKKIITTLSIKRDLRDSGLSKADKLNIVEYIKQDLINNKEKI